MIDDPQDPIFVGPHESNVRRTILEIKPGVERAILEMFRMAEADWDACPVAGCKVWREDGLVMAARLVV